MYDQMLDGFRRAAEATMQAQQELFRQWAQQVGKVPSAPAAPTVPPTPDPTAAFNGMSDRMRAMQRQWADTVSRTLEKHRETLDAQYKLGIRTIEDAFRVGEAKDPEQFRRLVEELWRHSFDALKSVTEAQLSEFRSVLQDWTEATSKAMATATKG